MKTGLIIVGIWSAFLLLLSLTIVGAFSPIYSGSYYWFTMPFILFAVVSVLLPITGLVLKPIRTIIFWIAVAFHGLAYFPFRYAIKRWPGGDDGPGMAWMIFIGGGSCIAGLISFVLAIVGVRIVLRKMKQAGQSG